MKAETQDLKDAGLKITLPRVKILKALENSAVRHVSAEDVYRLLLDNDEEIGLATVYRVLTQFEEAGLVTRHHFEGGHSVFELSPEAHHDHIVCVDCGEIFEFHDEDIEQRQVALMKKRGFEEVSHRHVLYAHCSYRTKKR